MIVANGGVRRAALALTRENGELSFEDALLLVERVLDAVDVPLEVQAVADALDLAVAGADFDTPASVICLAIAEQAIAALDKYRAERAEATQAPAELPKSGPFYTFELEGLLSLMLVDIHNILSAIAERKGMYLPADMASSAIVHATRCDTMLSALGNPIPDGSTWTVTHTEKLKRLAAEAKEQETGHGDR